MQHAITAAECGPEYAITGRLVQIQRVIEDKFCDAGEVLLRSLDAINDLIASLDTLAAAFDHKMAKATAADLTLAAAKLCTLPACHARHREAIVRLGRSREKLARHISVMRCSLTFMDAFVHNAEMMAEAAANDGIARFAEKIAGCVTGSETELKILEGELTALQRELGRAAAQGELLGRQIADQIPAVPEELSAAADFVGRHYTAVAATAGQVGAIARDIRPRVARLLEALQFGDITRQRIEHIEGLIADLNAEAAWQPAGTRERLRATCYALIARHMAEIDADFDREIGEIEDNMGKLAADAGALLKLHDIAFEHDGGRKAGFLHALGARVDGASKLVAAIAAADQSAMTTGRATIESAHKLGTHIDRIEALRNDMRAAAAPAAGIGAPSLTLAADEIRGHCHVLEEAARVGLVTLDKLLNLTRTVAGRGDAEQPQDSKAVDAASALSVVSRRICDVRQKTETGIGEIVAQGDAVVGMLSLSGTRLTLRREIGVVLSTMTDAAEKLSQGAYRAGEEMPAVLVDLLSRFSVRYTMAAERDVHRAFLEKLVIAPGEPVEALSDSDEILF